MAGFGRQAEGVEPHPVRPEREGLDQVGARVEVLAVEGRDQVGARRRELVEAGALGDPAREQQRAHAAVREQRGGGEAGGEPVAGKAHRRQAYPVVSLERNRGVARRRPSVSVPSGSSSTCGAAGRPL